MLAKALVSRALLRTIRSTTADNLKQVKRNSGHGVWSYRIPPPAPSKRSIILAETLGGICWWWILYHIWTEPEHVYGEWPYVEPCTWTDEELGIPPDDKGSIVNLKK